MRRNCNHNLNMLPSNSSSSSSTSIFANQLVSCSDHKRTTSDATELQVISILWVARTEMEAEKSKSNPKSPSVHGGLSLKKSLQKFLQRRKDRIQASMPYYIPSSSHS